MAVTFGERLKLLIIENGLEQQKLAAFFCISPSTLSGYVRNKKEPSIDRIIKLADYFNVSTDYLLGRSDIQDPYLSHLTGEMNSFVRDPENAAFIEMVREMKSRMLNVQSVNTENLITGRTATKERGMPPLKKINL